MADYTAFSRSDLSYIKPFYIVNNTNQKSNKKTTDSDGKSRKKFGKSENKC